MKTPPRSISIAVIGAGMAGPLISILLARKGYLVTLFERRALVGGDRLESGRSFNLTLTKRGLAAFQAVGLEDEVKATSMPLRSRTTHRSKLSNVQTRYGTQKDDVLYSIKRTELNQLLINAAQSTENISICDQREYLNFDSSNCQLTFKDLSNGEIHCEAFDYLIGADGINSRVREVLQRGKPSDLKREYFEWAYREFSISKDESENLNLSGDSLHVWPAEGSLLIAIPNRDGSFTGDVLLPRQGSESFETITNAAQWNQFFSLRYHSIHRSVQNLQGESINNRKTGYLQTLSTNIWTDSVRVLLLGDAAHGVFPFYGQGMNSALEDCLILDSLLNRTGENMPESFRLFEKERKIDTDALCELSRQHFFELKNGHRNNFNPLVFFTGGKTIYSMVAHSTRPYREALSELKRQKRLAYFLKWAALPAVAFLVAIVIYSHPFSLSHLNLSGVYFER